MICERSLNQPEVNQPEVNQPEVNQPEVNQPEVNQPEVNQPEVNQPEVKQPEVKQTHSMERRPEHENTKAPVLPDSKREGVRVPAPLTLVEVLKREDDTSP